MLTNSGIYKITSPSGKCYIGSALMFKRRWKLHRVALKAGKHHSRPLQSASNKYGVESMKFEILFLCAPEHLLMYEQRALDVFKPEYNVAVIAGSSLGIKRTEETRKRIGDARRGAKQPREAVERTAEQLRGRKLKPEHVAKVVAWHTGKKRPPETVERLKAAAAKRGEEWKRRVSESKRKANYEKKYEDQFKLDI